MLKDKSVLNPGGNTFKTTFPPANKDAVGEALTVIS